MKSLVKAFLITSSVWAASAQAHVTIPNLWADYERQQKWEAVTLEVEGVQGGLPAYLTEGKEIVMGDLNGTFRSAAKIESPTWGLFNSRARFKGDCRLMKSAMERFRKRNNAYSISLSAIPLSQGFYTVVRANGQREKLAGPANQIELLSYFTTDIKQNPSSMIAETMPDLELLKNQIADQIGKQKKSFMQTGQLKLDLTSYDDVVCDLLHGEIEISLTLQTKGVHPKLTRIPLFQSSEIEKVYGEMNKRAADLNPRLDAKVMNSAYLSIALGNSGHDIDQLDAWEYDKLFGMLVDRSNGRLLQLGNDRLKDISRSMDRFKSDNMAGKLIFNLDVPKGE